MSREYKEIPPLTIKQVDRFYSKYAISTTPPNFSSPCWNWTGTVSGGYGRLSIGKLWFKAHRISYYLHHKELPTDLTIDHLCKNTLCVNPEHLEPVTSEENLSRTKRDWSQGLCNKGLHDLAVVGYKTKYPKNKAPHNVCVGCTREIERKSKQRSRERQSLQEAT